MRQKHKITNYVDIRVIMSFCTASNALKDKSKVRGDFWHDFR